MSRAIRTIALVVISLLISLSTAGAAIASPACGETPGIPQEAFDLVVFVATHNGNPPPGLKGGAVFRDDAGRLPAHNAPWREYDVFPAGPGGRRAERVVIGHYSSEAYYSPDHYTTFILMNTPCVN